MMTAVRRTIAAAAILCAAFVLTGCSKTPYGYYDVKGVVTCPGVTLPATQAFRVNSGRVIPLRANRDGRTAVAHPDACIEVDWVWRKGGMWSAAWHHAIVGRYRLYRDDTR